MGALVKKPTRQSELNAWLVRHRVKKMELAKLLGVSYQRLVQQLRGIYMTDATREKLVSAGIPAELLPGSDE
ncbi:hypothetical protein NLA06_06100 [Desulfomicrobium sp. ZS1]|jgi:hypothetical protein|uniref:hypothetical protein n=1 Tax=Desulfomicrobium sp. ZS1 TaxID=2952228 RepID=UPI0020B1D54C|nr:hypothetical protein [Desulfomicrobium sp. ZS1]UTF51459.1 hypothetical protein NLA06_06100 [Desulfomicrobium sp. ZS1]